MNRLSGSRAEPSRADRRKARMEGAILEAAERHFYECGYADARVDDIAERADVAVGSLYNHFGSKDGLYLALLDRALDSHADYMEEAAAAGRPALDQVLAMAEAYARFAHDHPGHLRMLVSPVPLQADQPGGDVAARVGERLAEQERRTAELIAAAVEAGDARPVDPRRASVFLWSAWNGLLTQAGRVRRPLTPTDMRAVADAGLQMLVGGLAADEARDSDEAVKALLARVTASPGTDAAPERELELVREPVEPDLKSEFAGLGLWSTLLHATPGKSPAPVKERLKTLSDRFTGGRAVNLRNAAVPMAYRIFFRQLGLDPDRNPTPIEAASLERMKKGGFSSKSLLDDALLIALLETGVPVVAFDADHLDGRLALRFAREGERVGEGRVLSPAEIVVADSSRALSLLFGEPAMGRGVVKGTRRIALAAVQIKGVPDVSVEEALWTAVETLRSGD